MTTTTISTFSLNGIQFGNTQIAFKK
uniref:Uncharacterized protein n=1 Tax=Vitis vinifera TaxID=29760 RepID=F6H4V8_VITVI